MSLERKERKDYGEIGVEGTVSIEKESDLDKKYWKNFIY